MMKHNLLNNVIYFKWSVLNMVNKWNNKCFYSKMDQEDPLAFQSFWWLARRAQVNASQALFQQPITNF